MIHRRHTVTAGLLAAGLVIAACGGPANEEDTSATGTSATETESAPAESASSRADTSFKDDCLVVASDARGQEDIGDMGTDAEGFCECAEAVVSGMPEADQASTRMTMKQVAIGMEDSGDDTETVVGDMMAEAMAQGDDPDAQSVIKGVQLIGQMIDDIDEGFSETGACPAS